MTLIVRDDEVFASAIESVITTTVVPTADGERILDPGAPPRRPNPGTIPLEVEWPAGAMFEHAGYLFPVTVTATRLVHQLDPEGRVSRAKFFDGDGRLVSTISVERDPHGRMTAIVSDAGVEVRQAYNDAKRQVTTTVSLGGLAATTKVRTIDERGLVAREEETTMDGVTRIIRYVHMLNDRDDWIERAAYIDGAPDPAVITRRRIVYRD
jgi:YD repeat-containing protein